MKNSIINDIYKLSNVLYTYINDINYDYIYRNKKTDIRDGFAFQMYCSKKGVSQNNSTSKLNFFKNTNHSRSTYCNRKEQLTQKFFESINSKLDSYSYNTFLKNKKYRIHAVDGSKITMLNNKKDLNIRANKNGNTFTSLFLGVYDILNGSPITLELVDHENERKSFLDFIANKEEFANNIFIFDKGYFGQDFFAKLETYKIKYICKVQDNCSFIPKESTDKNINLKIGLLTRFVTYTLNDKNHYLITNLFDKNEFSIKNLQEFYHARWDIEEFFKFLKYYLKFNEYNDKSKKSIMLSIQSQVIACKLMAIIEKLCEKNVTSKHNHNYIINKKILADGFYEEFILRFIYKKDFTKKFIKRFLKSYIIFISSYDDRHFERCCIQSYYKWSGKQRTVRRDKTLDRKKERYVERRDKKEKKPK